MSEHTHIIQRQIVELRVPSADVAEGLQRAVDTLWEEQLEPVLERALDDWCPAGDVRVIERLELDLGRLKLTDFEQQLTAGVERALDRSLEKAEFKTPTPNAAHEPPQSEQNPRSVEPRVLHFLQTGGLPWWSASVNHAQLSAELTTLTAEAPGELRRWLIATGPDPRVGERLVRQFGTTHALAITVLMAPSFGTWLRELVHGLRSPTSGTHSRPAGASDAELVRVAWHVLAQIAEHGDVDQSLSETRGRFQHALGQTTWQWLERSLPASLRPSLMDDTDATRRSQKAASVPAANSPRGAAAASRDDGEPARTKHAVQAEPHHGELSKTPRRESRDPRQDVQPIDVHPHGEAVPIANAGLILLWPYLPTLLERRGYRNDDGWTTADAPRRAVHLLQHLVAQDTPAMEHELLLNKLLCGLAPDDPVDFEIALLKPDADEADALLSAVMQHWTPLNNSSVASLRQSFLQRPGLLEAVDQDWRLRVERRAYDLLLESLPWGLGLVRLSWMQCSIEVQW